MSISFFKEASDKATPAEVLKKAEVLESLAKVASKIHAREAYVEALSTGAERVRDITNAYNGMNDALAAKL